MHAHPPARRSAFTLVELLVVLAILGALTLVAVRSIAPVQARLRFETTQRALAETETAILGDHAAHGSGMGALFPGFLTDVGRLPNTLPELWILPIGMATSHVATDLVDAEVQLSVGWRGPYLRLAPGATNLLDGWGNPLAIDTSQGWRLASLGPDGLPATGDELQVVLVDPILGIQRTVAELSGAVRVLSDHGPNLVLSVYVYGPDPLTGQIAEVHVTVAVVDPEHVPFAFLVAAGHGLTPGPRTVRAYLNDSAAQDRPAALAKSTPQVVVLRPGAQVVELEIP